MARRSLHKARESLIPLLSAELFSALLTVAAVYLTHRLGVTGFILFGLVLVIFQYLIVELLTSKRRSDKLQRIATTDELTGLGNREHFSEVIEQAHRRRARVRCALRGAAHGPRPLQGDQRHARPPLRRPVAPGARTAPDLRDRRRAASWRAWAATSSGSCWRRTRMTRRCWTWSSRDCSSRSASHSWSMSCRSRSGPASAWPASPRTPRTPTGSCAAPTSRCTRPRKPRPTTRSTPRSRTSTPSSAWAC